MKRALRFPHPVTAVQRAIWFMALLAALAVAPAGAQGNGVAIELNKLEPASEACDVYLVVENATESTFRSLSLDLVVFDTDGIISERLALETAPLPAGKTSVKVFALDGLACSEVSRMLLNDVLACEDAGGAREQCLRQITTDSVAQVPFIK